MAKFRIGFGLPAVLTLLAGLGSVAAADPPPVSTMLAYKPHQSGIDITTPTEAEMAACKVELEPGRKVGQKQATAWVLKDGQGRVLRKFHDTTGDGPVNMFAYYKDGEEVYREIDTNANGKIDQYRWVGSYGHKWGVDTDEDGKIDSWLAISPEELSQELLAAVINKDQKRFEALLMSTADLDTLGLPAAELQRIQAKLAGATAQFQKTCQALAKLPADTLWVHLETKAPQTTPADTLGAKADLVRYRHAAILYQEGDGRTAKHNWIQTGEVIQIGRAWKLIQGPVPGVQQPDQQEVRGPSDGPGTIPIPAGAEKLIEELNKHDQAGPTEAGRQGIIKFNLARGEIIQKIAGLYTKPEDRAKQEVWLRQVADCLAAAAQQGDAPTLKRLTEWRSALAKDRASALLPYVEFREISAEYAQKLGPASKDQDKLNKLQDEWKDKLTKFINDFPAADDTADALMQLGVVNEFFGSKKEPEAKAAYAKLVKSFPKHALARRAQGCLDRLSLEGSVLNLAGPVLGGGPNFNIKSLLGKAVVVYYWASWNEMAASDFEKVKLALKAFNGKADLVCVNLDYSAAEALKFLKANPMDGTHLHMPGGLESPLAVQYGITALPVMFLVGPDGKVVNRAVGAPTLDEELKKLFKVPDDKEEKDKKDK
jgi:hypothetical protein